tara:strand:+ start:1384 stop:1500 length:117 start_codon:yes stop_codon:yes gene_type:complete
MKKRLAPIINKRAKPSIKNLGEELIRSFFAVIVLAFKS